jgi:hypothetical protein
MENNIMFKGHSLFIIFSSTCHPPSTHTNIKKKKKKEEKKKDHTVGTVPNFIRKIVEREGKIDTPTHKYTISHFPDLVWTLQ